MGISAIEWTDRTWNPTVGCMKVSAGCENCYAIRTAYRLAAIGQEPYKGLTKKLPDGSVNWTGVVRTLPERLRIPMGWRAPSRIFVDSMSDLFHEDVPSEFIDQVFATMALTPQHTYQVLTKRPQRMLSYLVGDGITRRGWIAEAAAQNLDEQWPLPNVWLGVSVEDQRAADERIPLLLQTPAAVRFLSCEPLLGPVDLEKPWPNSEVSFSHVYHPWMIQQLDWVIAGGESGPGFRPMDQDWARSLRDQCQAAGVAFFCKQSSGPRHGMGRELDGRTWEEFPTPRAVAPC